ncbi:MAG: hypothetical protein ACI9A7_002507 [Cyclobacteriaceae bacterium]|jgi:hypothetical protein
MLRVLNLVKVVSAFIFLGILLLVYAYLPVMVEITPDQSLPKVQKEDWFYYAIAIFLMVNLFLFIIQKMTEPLIEREDIKAMLRGFAFVINFYMTCLIGFVGVINNTTSVSLSSYAYLNFIGPVFIVGWIVGLIVVINSKAKTV